MRNTQNIRMNAAAGSIISARMYNLLIGAVLLYGFAMNLVMIRFLTGFALSIQPIPMLIGYMVLSFIGTKLVNSSRNPFVSFLGYNLVVLPIGFLLTRVLIYYDPGLVFRAMVVTGCVTGIMMLVAGLFPVFFRRLGRVLFMSLISLIVVEVLAMIFGWFVFGVTDLLAAVIFCGYIAVEWVHAQDAPKTVDNAIDVAAMLYVSIINLFLRILSIMSRNNN